MCDKNRKEDMNKKYQYVQPAVICLLSFLGSMILGCGGGARPMALGPKAPPLQLAAKPVGLFVIRTSNQYKPGFQPNVTVIGIKAQGTGENIAFLTGKPFKQEKDSFNEYLVSIDLPPGKYTIENVAGNSTNILIMASFGFPIGASFELTPDTVMYLGRITMTNRKRIGDEPRSGSIFPLVDQGVAGYGDGTFDVSIEDESGTDIQYFEQTYPEIKEHLVSKNIMLKQ
jgi:hypothetical protein